MEFIDMIKRSAMKLGRGLRHVKTNKDGVHGEEDPDKKITVGICVLEKKALSSPMTEVCFKYSLSLWLWGIFNVRISLHAEVVASRKLQLFSSKLPFVMEAEPQKLVKIRES